MTLSNYTFDTLHTWLELQHSSSFLTVTISAIAENSKMITVCSTRQTSSKEAVIKRALRANLKAVQTQDDWSCY